MPPLSEEGATERSFRRGLRAFAGGLAALFMGFAVRTVVDSWEVWSGEGLPPSTESSELIAFAFAILGALWFTAFALLSGAPRPDPILEVIREEREACAQTVRTLSEIRGRQECCGVGVYGQLGGPPECCGNPRLMIDAEDAAEAILEGGAAFIANPPVQTPPTVQPDAVA